MEDKNGVFKPEIDTSAPFDSVKDAVNLFGGLGFWKPTSQSIKNSPTLLQCELEDVDVSKVEEQAAELEKELKLKERDTLEVLKELEATKMIVEELKSKLRKEESKTTQLDNNNVAREEEEEEKENNPNLSVQTLPQNAISIHSSSPSMILMELKQAKLNLTRTTSDLVAIRASVETYNKKIERERISLEKTRERLRTNSSKISSLEEEISITRSKLEEVNKDGSARKECNDNNGIDIMAKLQQLTTEADEFKKMGEVAKSEVIRVMLEIEQTKSKVKTTEVRLVAAQKMKDAAKAAEAVALAEINALEKSESGDSEGVTLTLEEYSSLKSKAQVAEERSNERVIRAMVEIDEANASKDDILKRVEEAMEEVKASKQVLEDALSRVEQANRDKLLVEEALRKWRSDNGEKRRSVQNSTKFKNPCPSHHRRMLDVNGITLVNDENAPVLKPTLSIGQILSNKLLIAEEFESGKGALKRKVSLGQMLGKPSVDVTSAWKVDHDSSSGVAKNKIPAKRKKFGFQRISVLLTKQSKKKKSIFTATR